MESILPIWQPVGYSTHKIAKAVAEKYGVKTSHTGTLDPLAQGVIIVLLGEDRLKKYEYAHWHKTYEFEIILGISTDTYDGMGLITEQYFNYIPNGKEDLSDFIGSYTQQVPLYSTIKVKGRSLHEHARANNSDSIVLPKKQGEIFDIKVLGVEQYESSHIKKALINTIQRIDGDFRQQKIIDQWNSISIPLNLSSLKVKVTTSKGIYVRSLSQDICENLGVIGFTYNLARTKNGEYQKQNSKSIEELTLNL